ncbi:GTP 3',8-cyclase [Gammaproteobacteria bacterium]
MHDNFNRKIDYLRISVTDRCNLRCHYCMPQEGIQLKKHQEIISSEEIFHVVKIAVEDCGFTKIRLTGGEPLLRHGIVDLVKMLAGITGIEDLAMTTNGILLEKFAADLKHAGLNRVNVSLDTMDAKRFFAATRGGNILEVFKGITTALTAGLTPLKINCVVEQSSDEEDARAVKQYASEKGITVRFIQRMDFIKGIFRKIEGGQAGDCVTCNRLRLLSDGRILPCLFSDKTFSIKELGIYKALLEAIKHKPERGNPCLAKWMVSVGG